MSSDPPSDAPSAPPERPIELSLDAARVRVRGLPLVDALDRHLPGARDHGDATAAYAFATAVELGHGRDDAELLREAAKLHEVGMIYAAEDHHEQGAALARGAGIPEEVCAWLLHVGDRFDGEGSEAGGGEGIPIEARIIRAACLCNRLLEHASAEPRAAAIGSLREAAGAELDPRVVEAMVAVLERA